LHQACARGGAALAPPPFGVYATCNECQRSLIMSDQDLHATIERLQRENAQLSGLALATGVLLTQLLQSNLKRELNPWKSATKMMDEARAAIEGFKPETTGEQDPAMKARALDALAQYDEQIKSVLPA
jgi:hypothetical protein